MKNVLQIIGVFFVGALIGLILLSFGLSVDISMMTGTVIILILAYLVTKQNNKEKK
ncbi:hypothetical protein OA530_01570 [Pelagibacteraceae bacterium]|nr:hypothetical protein [Pelagibacteraceae bacterium]